MYYPSTLITRSYKHVTEKKKKGKNILSITYNDTYFYFLWKQIETLQLCSMLFLGLSYRIQIFFIDSLLNTNLYVFGHFPLSN